MASDRLLLQLLITADGTRKTVGDLKSIQQSIADNSSETVRAAQVEADLAQKAVSNANLKIKALRDAFDLAKDLAKDTARIASTASSEDRLVAKAVATDAAKAADLASRAVRDAAKEVKALGEISVEASRKFKEAKEQEAIATRASIEAVKQAQQEQQRGNSVLGGGIAELAFRYNTVVQSLQNLRATAQPVYDALIASNENLNAQILSSQTNLASSTRIFKGGVELSDPAEKIKATAGQLKAAIKQIEIDTQGLVGVTSAQVNELFQVTITNAGLLNNQSKQFPDAIAAATSLTKGWAASLKVIGIPLDEARANINEIIKGQITQESKLAKNLSINNQMVETWRSQGRLVDELNKRLEVFVAGNAIAARSISGIGSNIRDLSERLGRNIGASFLNPIIDALAEVEIYLKNAEGSITQLFGRLSAEILSAGGTIGQAFAPVGKTLLEIGADIGPIALSAIKGLLQVFVNLSNVVAPLANLLLGAVKILGDFAATDLGGVVVQTGTVVLVMGQLVTILAGLSAAALPALGSAVIATVTSLGTLYASVVAVATGNTAMALSIPALQAAFASLSTEAVALNLALAPLTAALALAVLLKTSGDLKTANDNLEVYEQQILSTADAYNVIGVELNKYNEIVKNGGTLTIEQIARQKQLRASASAQSESIENQIKVLKNLKVANADQATQRDNDIKQLEALATKLDKAAGGIKTQSKLVEELGTTSEQAAKKLANLKRLIATDGGGEKVALDSAFKETISQIQLQTKNYELSAQAGIEALLAVQNNTKADISTQLAAKDAAVAIRKQRLDLELAAITTEQSKIAALTSQQRLGEAKGDEETTKLKLAEFAKRAEANRTAIDAATTDTERSKLKAEGEKDAADSEKTEAEFSARRRKRAIEDFDERRNLVKAQNDVGAIDRNTYNQQILFNDIAQNDVQLAQQQEALTKLGADDIKGRNVIDGQIAQLQSKRIEIARTYDKADLQRQTENYDQLLGALETFKNEQIISEDEFIQSRSQNRIAQADAELSVANRQLSRLGENDIEGRNAINAKINQLSDKRLKALEESYASELVLIKDREQKALDLVNQSEKQRAIDLQQLVNSRTITLENADKERSRSTLTNQRASLKQAQDFELALAQTAGSKRSPEVERAYQQQVRESRSKTLEATLSIIQTEGAELERLRTLALKGIEDTKASRTRSADLQLSQIASVRGEQDRSTKEVEANASREVAAIDIASKALERQSALLTSRNNLNKANSDAKVSRGEIDIAKLDEALKIRKELESGIVSYQEYQAKINRLQQLGVSTGESTIAIERRKLELEKQQASKRLSALTLEQTVARSSLILEQQKNDLANQRLLIEARIAEFKAKQAVLDAKSNVQQTEQNSQKLIDAAQLALTTAQAQKPGRERDRAIADAEAKLTISKTESETNKANAAQGVELAQQQVTLAAQTTDAAIKNIANQSEIKKLQTETLDIQQKTVLEQFKAAESAKTYANELERAKLNAEALKATLGSTRTFTGDGVQTLPARASGGNVQSGKPYLVGENSPEVFVPNASGTILNREQLTKNFSNLGSLNLNVGSNPDSTNKAVVDAVKSLQQTIESRPPSPIVANFNAPDDNGVDKIFALHRASLRIN